MRSPCRNLLLLVPLVAAACVVDAGPKPPVASPSDRPAVRKASPTSAATASPAPTATPAGLTPTATPAPVVLATPTLAPIAPARREALLAALHEAFPAGRASRVTSLLGDASGVLANNAASLISDNGGGLISDNGGGFTSKTKYGLLQLPGQRPEAGTIAFFTAATEALVYEVTAYTEQSGRFRSFDRAGWDARTPETRVEVLVDEFTWHEVVYEHPYGGDPTQLALTYKLRKQSSTRVPFADKIAAREIFRVGVDGSEVDAVPIGWDIAFDLDMALPGAQPEKVPFRAVAGEADLELVPRSDGDGVLSVPKNMALSGENARGSYVGAVRHGQAIETTITHATPAGARATLAMTTRKDGSRRHAVTAEAAALRVVAEAGADGKGQGHVEDLEGRKVGGVTWDAAGLATIAFDDGATLVAPLF